MRAKLIAAALALALAASCGRKMVLDPSQVAARNDPAWTIRQAPAGAVLAIPPPPAVPARSRVIEADAAISSQPSPAPAPLAGSPSKDYAKHMAQARFSARRFIVESLAGALVGSLVGYGTYKTLCGDHTDCLGSAFAGWAMNFAVTPVVTWGTGRWMGGEGSLSWTYYGGVVALSPFSIQGRSDETPDETISRINFEFALSTLLLPLSTALMYELTSHRRAEAWLASQPASISASIAPVYTHEHLDGVVAHVSLSF